MTASLTQEVFAKQLNTIFRIQVDEAHSLEAELTEVSEQVVSGRQERFSVVFRAPNDQFLGQGTRRFEHEEMKTFDLFLVPIGRDEQGTYYEAIFNRLRPPDTPTA